LTAAIIKQSYQRAFDRLLRHPFLQGLEELAIIPTEVRLQGRSPKEADKKVVLRIA
jgi:hypothetical protein